MCDHVSSWPKDPLCCAKGCTNSASQCVHAQHVRGAVSVPQNAGDKRVKSERGSRLAVAIGSSALRAAPRATRATMTNPEEQRQMAAAIQQLSAAVSPQFILDSCRVGFDSLLLLANFRSPQTFTLVLFRRLDHGRVCALGRHWAHGSGAWSWPWSPPRHARAHGRCG